MASTSTLSKTIDRNIFNGDYYEIKDEICNLLIQVGNDLKWKLINSNNSTLKFKTPISFRSFGETVEIDYSISIIYVKSTANQTSVVTTWGKNDDNCKNYLDKAIPTIKSFLHKKEEERQKNNLQTVNSVIQNNKKIEIDKTLLTIISNNQDKIEKNLIPNFLKLYQYYCDQAKTQNIIYENIKQIDFYKLDNSTIEEATEAINVFSSSIEILHITIKKTFEAYIAGDLILFYSFYNKFEDMGLFMSKGEKMIINTLEDINYNLQDVISGIDSMVDKISNLSDELSNIENSISYAGLLQTINTYQLYRLRNK